MNLQQLGEAFVELCGALNAMIAINTAFADELLRSASLGDADRERFYTWNRDLCLTNLRVDRAMAKGRPLITSPTAQ